MFDLEMLSRINWTVVAPIIAVAAWYFFPNLQPLLLMLGQALVKLGTAKVPAPPAPVQVVPQVSEGQVRWLLEELRKEVRAMLPKQE